MGYDLNRFKSHVIPDLICFICKHVPEDPVAVKCCQNMFCEKCINEWLQNNNNCPDDGQPLDVSLLLVVHKLVVNILNELDICCDFAANGCQVVVKVRDIKVHEKVCPFNERGREEEKVEQKCKECESLSSGTREMREEVKQLKEENKWITEILKKQINAFGEMRTELKQQKDLLRREKSDESDLLRQIYETKTELKERVEEMKQQQEVLKKEMMETTDLLRQELVEYKRQECETREKRGGKATAARKKPYLETVPFPVSREHENLVIGLKEEGLIKSDKVFNAIKAIDGKNYFSPDAQYRLLRNRVPYLEKWSTHLKKGFNVLFVSFYSSAYYYVCLAEMVGEKGSVVAFISTQKEREDVDKDHNYLLSSKRLTLELITDNNERTRGSPVLSPFHLIIDQTPKLKPSEIKELKKQLTLGGKIIRWDSGDVLF